MLSSQARYSPCRAISAATGSALRRGRGGRCCAGAEGGGCDFWECRTPIVNRDCHVSGWLGQVDPACCSSRFRFQFFVRSAKAVLRRSLQSGSRRAPKGSRERLAAVARLGFRSAVTPEHAARVCEIYPGVRYLCRYPADDRREARHWRGRSRHTLVFGRFRADPDHDESCTSAAELRDGRPIL